jgi:hypothetical protein
VGGVPDVLGGLPGARLVPAGDAAAIAAAVANTLDSPPPVQAAALASALTIGKYGMARLLRESGALYDELTAGALVGERVPSFVGAWRTRCAT